MIKVIPARIEDGHVIPSEPLPQPSEIEGVSVVLDLVEPARPSDKQAALGRLRAMFEGVRVDDDVDFKAEYSRYLQEKYR